MLGKILLALIVTLFVVKIFFHRQWRALKVRLDRTVNILLWVLGLSYALQLIFKWWGYSV